jgi:hypothetical protein
MAMNEVYAAVDPTRAQIDTLEGPTKPSRRSMSPTSESMPPGTRCLT